MALLRGTRSAWTRGEKRRLMGEVLAEVRGVGAQLPERVKVLELCVEGPREAQVAAA